MTNSILANAIERNFNVVVSTPPGMGVVNSTLEELRKVSDSIIVLNENSLRLDLITAVSMQTEVIVFDSLERTDTGLQDTAAELMHSRSLSGIKLRNLKSVVCFFIRSTDEMDDLADSYAALGPSLAMDWR